MTFVGATLGFSLGILGPAPAVDVAVGARGETGVGFVPVSAAEPATFASQNTVDARVGLRLLSLRQTFVLRGGPRLLYLVPNVAELDRPLVYSQLDASYSLRVSRTVDLSAGATGGYGELSYASLAQSFFPGTGAVDARVVPLIAANATLGFGWRRTRLHSLGWSFRGSLQDSNEETADSPPVIPSFRTAGTELSSTHFPTSVDTFSYRVGIDAFVSERDGSFYATRGGMTWSREFAANSRLGTSLRGEWIRTSTDSANYFLPSVEVDLQTEDGNSARTWTVRGSTGIRGFFDRLNFLYLPQAFTQASLEVRWNPDVRSLATLFASTSATAEPALPGIFETFIGLDLENRYRLSPSVDLLLGIRTALRGPHLTVFATNLQGQALLFVGFDWSEGTDSDRGRFVR